MIFSSITFIFYFLPLFLFFYYATPHKFKNLTLLLFSLLFYSWGEPKYIFLMLFSSVVDYIHALIIERNRGTLKSKLALISSILINLGLLGYFKYTNFFIGMFNSVTNSNVALLEIVLPIGISFYTFQTMSYTIDVYRGETRAQRNLLSLATYVSLFPQLVAGPIVRYTTVTGELESRVHSVDKFYEGLMRFFIGLSKKVLIANNVGLIWESVKGGNYNELSLLTLWLGISAFALQIYYDFSGYSDMAIGLGKMLGFTFLENFNYPYISKSVTEFWRRWHMSLGTWFKDYIYIPLGGNKTSKLRWIFNIFVVWAMTGLWHGAGVNFILWGLYFGIILVIEKVSLKNIADSIPTFFKRIYVFIIINISWVIFELESLNDILVYIKSMFINKFLTDDLFYYLFYNNLFLIVLAIIGATPVFKRFFKNDVFKTVVSLAGFILSISYLIDASFNPFLYFRF